LGIAFGVVTEGSIRVFDDRIVSMRHDVWYSPYCLANGLLALSACAYLAAVYLTNETQGALREDFRWRAIFAGISTAILAILVLILAWSQAEWFFNRLVTWRTLPIVIGGIVCFAGSAWAIIERRFVLARAFAASQIILLLVGWA